MPAEVAGAKEHLSASTSCCDGPSKFRYVPLLLGARFDTELTQKSPTYRFAEGAAYFAAFSLPQTAGVARALELYTPLGDYLPTAAYIDPVVVFLDGKHHPVGKSSGLVLKYGYHGLFKAHHYEVELPVPDSAEFVVVYADPSSTRRARAYSDDGTPYTISPRPIGPLFLRVRALPHLVEPQQRRQG